MAESLRDTISEAFDSTVADAAPIDKAESIQTVDDTAVVEDKANAGSAASNAADRARDEQGRFVEGKPEKQSTDKAAQSKAPVAKAQPAAQSVSKAPAQQQLPGVAPAAQPAPAPQRPSTWKKEHWESYDKLARENPALAQYILQREGEFAKGVSTYKQEWEQAKPLLEAVAPYRQSLQAAGVSAEHWISRLGQAHQALYSGSPEQKLSMFAKLAQDYQVPIHNLVVQGQDGKLYMNPNIQQSSQQMNPQHAQYPQASQAQGAPQIDALIEAKLLERETASALKEFEANTTKYPNYQEVRETMAQALDAGLANGLEDAYDVAIRHPRHAHLFEAQQQQQRQQEVERQAEERRKATEVARRKAVSPRSASPTSSAGAGDGKKGLRAAIEEAFDSNVAGRV